MESRCIRCERLIFAANPRVCGACNQKAFRERRANYSGKRYKTLFDKLTITLLHCRSSALRTKKSARVYEQKVVCSKQHLQNIDDMSGGRMPEFGSRIQKFRMRGLPTEHVTNYIITHRSNYIIAKWKGMPGHA